MSGSTHRRRGAVASVRGLFMDGIWHCDCSPRQPANHFEVKKQGPNQGKWFRTCQKQQNDKSRCKFFLWDSDAHPREAAALACNSRTEPPRADPKTPSKRSASPLPDDDSRDIDISRKRPRTSSTNQYDGDEFDSGTDEAFQNEMSHIMTAVETPRKATKSSDFATPPLKRTLPWNKDKKSAVDPSGLQTPQTAHTVRPDPLPSNLGKLLRTPPLPINVDHQTATPSSSPYETPTPNRFRDVGQDDLVHDVFELLRVDQIRFGATTERNLKDLLSRYTKAAEGLRRGRDVTRSTIKARDAKVTELSYRISTLEAELEAERAVVRHLQWKIGTEDHETI